MSETHTGSEPSEMPWSRVVTFADPQPCVAAQAHRDRPSREIKMNAVLLHDAQRCARFQKRWSAKFSLLDEIVKLQPRAAQQKKLRSLGHDRDTQTPKL